MLAAPDGRASAPADETEFSARLLRFTAAAVGRHRAADLLLEHSLAETSEHSAAHGHPGPPHDGFVWTMTVRSCRSLLAPAEASHWWAHSRAAEHAWADAAVTADADLVDEAAREYGRLGEVLATMPDVDRIALLLHDVELMPLGEVAAVMRSSEEIAMQRIRRGRMTLVATLAGVLKHAEGHREAEFDDGDCARARLAAAARPGDVSGAADPGIEAHTGRCDPCAGLVVSLDRVGRQLNQWPIPEPSAELVGHVTSLRTEGRSA